MERNWRKMSISENETREMGREGGESESVTALETVNF